MSTLQEVQQRQFAEDHQRIMRALYDSVSKNNELHIQLRRMKEELVSTALRLQVATKIRQDDENTISSLRRVAEEARTEAIIANKQSHEANELIQSLNSNFKIKKPTNIQCLAIDEFKKRQSHLIINAETGGGKTLGINTI